MRIIAGRFKGRRLPSPKAKGVRPTADRIREAIFSALGPDAVAGRVLDLFAGTGAFGLEALSRGAESVTFVDRDRAICANLRRVCEELGVTDSVEIIPMDARKAVDLLAEQDRVFEIAFLDPPYEQGSVEEILARSGFRKILSHGSRLVIEREAVGAELDCAHYGEPVFSKRYGGTRVDIIEIGYPGPRLSGRTSADV